MTPTDPPFWQTAAKFLASLIGAVVLAGGVILAAFDDDHVTTQEIVAIVLAVLGGLGLPTAVYTVPNAFTRAQLRKAAATPAGRNVLRAEKIAAVRTVTDDAGDGSAAAAREYPPPIVPPVDPGIDTRGASPWAHLDDQ